MTIGLAVSWSDAKRSLDRDYVALLAAAVRDQLHVPAPLSLSVYSQEPIAGTGRMIVEPTVVGAYAVVVGADGHLKAPRVVGGARNSSFDDAFLRALRAVDDSAQWPPPPKSAHGDDMELRLAVSPMDVPILGGVSFALPPQEPLFRMRSPILARERTVTPTTSHRENAPPPYPEIARRQGVEGKVLTQFIVDLDGRPDLGSVQVLDATAREFAVAVLQAIPDYRFEPLTIGGCHLATVVRLPFIFSISHQ